jgi:WD40 repeat protein
MSGVSSVPGDSPSVARFWQHSIGDHVMVLAWSPGGDMVAAGAISGSVTIFDARDGKIRHVMPAHTFGLTTLAWRPGTSEFATGGQDGNIRLWNAITRSEIGRLDGGDPWVERAAWRADGKVLATAAGRTLRLWDDAGRLLRSYADYPSTITDIKWVPGREEVSAAVYGGLICWRADQDKPVRKFEYKGSVLAIACSPDGRFIATGNQDSTIHLWIMETGKDLCMLGYSTKVRELSWHANSRFLATGGGPAVVVWDFSGKGLAGSKPRLARA